MPKSHTRCQRCGGIIDSGKHDLSFRCVTCGRTLCRNCMVRADGTDCKCRECSANEAIEEDGAQATSL